MAEYHQEETPLLPTERDEIDWAEFLAQFKDEIYPIFEHQGFTLPEALAVWKLNEIVRKLDRLPSDGDIYG